MTPLALGFHELDALQTRERKTLVQQRTLHKEVQA